MVHHPSGDDGQGGGDPVLGVRADAFIPGFLGLHAEAGGFKPGAEAVLQLLGIFGDLVDELAGLHQELRDDGGEQDEEQHHGHEENQDDGAGAGNLLVLQPIDHGVQQVGDDGRHGQGEQDGGEQVDQQAQRPDEQTEDGQGNADRQGGHGEPHDAGLSFAG